MYPAQVVRVFIASPGDVVPERNAATEIISTWNTVHSDRDALVLLPLRWETHSAPEMGDRPQAIVNRQVLAGADLLVAVFWTRIGTPTGSAMSGTVEEIQEHLDAGRPAMIYFSNAPAHPDSVDEIQLRQLREFRNACMLNGLCERFDSLEEFREKFGRQLALTINQAFGTETLNVEAATSEQIQLSSAAEELLLIAAEDPDGEIRNVRFAGGFMILSNKRHFNSDASARANALWKGALDELLHLGLVEDVNGEGHVFSVSQYGFAVVDQLKLRENDA